MTNDAVGGVWTYSLALAEALAEDDVEVTLATMGPAPGSDQLAQLAAVRVDRFESAPFALEWTDEPWNELDRAGEWLLRLAEEVQPDVVHLNGYTHAALDWAAPVIVVGHSDVLSWHEAVRGGPAGPEWARYRDAVSAGLAAADLLVAPTQAMLDALVRHYQPDCPRLVVPNGLGGCFDERPKEKLVLAAGRLWDDAKNIAAVVRVAPRLGWPVAIAGGDVEADGIRALGRLSRTALDKALASAAIFAAPACYEPFGLAPLEAARARCALVLGDIASLREVWCDAAVYVVPQDDDALADALLQLERDCLRRAELARRAHQRSLTYTPERMAAGYLQAYGLALCRKRAVA